MADQTKRAHPRVPANFEVKVRGPDGHAWVPSRIRNISLGGVFIETTDVLPFGDELVLEFKVPESAQVIRCKGLVMWNTKSPPPGYKGEMGMGLRLLEIGVKEMRLIEQFIAAALPAAKPK